MQVTSYGGFPYQSKTFGVEHLLNITLFPALGSLQDGKYLNFWVS